MEVDFKFGGSRIKRKAVALVLLGAPALVPLFFMLPALLTLNSNTFSVSVDDTLGTGAEICLFLCLLVTPMVTLTGQRWFVPLRRWYGIMMACTRHRRRDRGRHHRYLRRRRVRPAGRARFRAHGIHDGDAGHPAR